MSDMDVCRTEASHASSIEKRTGCGRDAQDGRRKVDASNNTSHDEEEGRDHAHATTQVADDGLGMKAYCNEDPIPGLSSKLERRSTTIGHKPDPSVSRPSDTPRVEISAGRGQPSIAGDTTGV